MNTNELVQKIVACSTAYYEAGNSPVSDAEFDKMIEQLRGINP